MCIFFKAHNILLPNGKHTIGGNQKLLSEKPVIKVIQNSINNFLPHNIEDRKNIKLVDLGCMEGGYSTEFARMGFDTLGIDARKENLLKAMYIKLSLNLPNLNFVKDDARNLSKYGNFDITFCFGLFYHLDNPFEFLKTVYKQTNRLLVLHTFYCPENSLQYSLEFQLNKMFPKFYSNKRKEFNQNEASKEGHTSYLQHIKNFRLYPELSENEGYKGRWFREWDEDKEREKIEVMPGASYNNYRSFWLCKNEIIRALHDAGFDNVYEQHDSIGDLTADNPDSYYPRGLFIAVKNK